MKIIKEYARMWPRWILEEEKLINELKDRLNHPGVYVLYRDDRPYYVGRADRLFRRLKQRAINPQSRHFHFWNFFSAYVVTDSRYLAEVEGILITSMAMVTANRANPKIPRIALSAEMWRRIREEHRRATCGSSP